ncbi:MAG: hypothetical protein C4297_07185 [Gemmataceae bacterium]
MIVPLGRTQTASYCDRKGLSLLEVLATLAVFMLSVVVLSQIVDSAARTARRSERLARAALLAESKLAELSAGLMPLVNAGPEPFVEEQEPGWSWTVTCSPETWSSTSVGGQGVIGLYSVQIVVTWQGEGEPIEYTLSSVILEPSLRSAPTASQLPRGNAAR